MPDEEGGRGGGTGGERVVPVLPCERLADVLPFYRALGFEVLHEQHAPYVYGSVRRGGVQLDFLGARGLRPDRDPGHTCLVMVPHVDALNAAFRAGVKAAYGRQLRSGLPRVGLVSQQKRDRRFNVADPAGNHLIFIEPRAAPKDPAPTPLGRAVKAATLSAYSQQDLGWAAGHLDEALEAAGGEPGPLRLRALVMRADLAAMMGDRAALARCIAASRAVPLSDAEAPEAAESLERLADLEAFMVEAMG